MHLGRIQELAGQELQGQEVVSVYSIARAGVSKDARLFVVCFDEGVKVIAYERTSWMRGPSSSALFYLLGRILGDEIIIASRYIFF